MKHQANRAGLHFDLRFKMPNSKDWDSFAVRKGVPTLPGKKVLAVRTTVHSEREALLVGKIEKGYGAGTLTKWDGGSCDIIKYKDKHIVLDLKGSKVKGIYHMTSTGYIDKKFDKKSYMLFKGKSVAEGSGMITRIPAIASDGDEVEEDQGNSVSKRLPWSIASKNTLLEAYLNYLNGDL
jgi:hypothetical protein